MLENFFVEKLFTLRKYLKLRMLSNFGIIGIGVDCVHLKFLNGCGAFKRRITAGDCICT